MTKLEKVLKGLDQCSISCIDCPYFDSEECTDLLRKDALELLKEQQKLCNTTKFVAKEELLEAMKKRKDFIGRPSDPVCIVEDAPTVDAVPVVHCSDCVHCQKSSYAGFWYCEMWDQNLNMKVHDPEKYFCAEGEKNAAD